jgi:hypothetical protein
MPISNPRNPTRSGPALLVVAMLALPLGAFAQSNDDPPQGRRSHTLKSPPRDNKVLHGVQRGADATGRGIDRAGNATERGIGHVSERASRPVRDLGERIGRKLGPGSSGHPGAPPVGPQGNAP